MDAAKETIPARPDHFRTSRIVALQPPMTAADLVEPVLATEDDVIHHSLSNLVKLWIHSRRDLPKECCQGLRITAVARQPLVFVRCDVQQVSRRLEQTETPFDGFGLDTSKWATNDPFELLPVNPLAFPEGSVSTHNPLAGQEQSQPCPDCQAAGSRQCHSCGGSGIRECHDCEGADKVACPRCGGTGTHIGVSGREINCQMCRTLGTIRCPRCGGKGEVSCDDCSGKGATQCVRCNGKRQLKTSWFLITETMTHAQTVPYLPEAWPIDVQSHLSQSDLVLERDCVWPVVGDPDLLLETWLPAQLRATAMKLLSECAALTVGSAASATRLTGIRLRVLATHLYRIDFECLSQPCRLYLGGAANYVFPHRLPAIQGGIFGRLRTMIRRAVRAFGTDDPLGLDKPFIAAVTAGRAHISDSRCLVSDLLHAGPCDVAVNEMGYQITVRVDLGKAATAVRFQASLDQDSQRELVVTTSTVLGPARRDRLAKAMAANHSHVTFGRLAIAEDHRTGEEQLLLVDRRPYADLASEEYYRILMEMAADCGELLKRGIAS